jgi:drug/metabolite transporter (DMT)-like permease
MASRIAIRLPAGAEARGVFWITLSILSFTCFMTAGRHVTQSMHPFEALFFRSIFMLAFMMPWALRHDIGPITWRRMGPFAVRGILAMANMTLLLMALALLPVADVSAINFIRPMLTTLLAVALLGEAVNAQRWIAIAVGFAGALVIIRPGFGDINMGVFLALASCATASVTFVLVKTLTGRESPDVIAFFQPVFVMPIAAALMPFVWSEPTWLDVGWCGVLGLFAILTHRTMNRAFAAVELSFLQPLDFIRLPLAAALGWFAFGDVTDIYTWIGGTIIFAASIYGTRGRAAP